MAATNNNTTIKQCTGEGGGRRWRWRATWQMIASTDWHNNQQTTEVIGWGHNDDGNEWGWPIAREERKDGNNDQSMSANTTITTGKQQSTQKVVVVKVERRGVPEKGRTLWQWQSSTTTELNGSNVEEEMAMKHHQERRTLSAVATTTATQRPLTMTSLAAESVSSTDQNNNQQMTKVRRRWRQPQATTTGRRGTQQSGWRRQYKITIHQKLGAGNEHKGGGNLDIW